jgi:urate oxidase
MSHKINPIAGEPTPPITSNPTPRLSQLRAKSFPVPIHCHGKAKVRVMKVVRTTAKHFAYEYSVDTTLYSPTYERVFTAEDNTDLVATDTQKNTVYVVAKRTKADTPEQFGVDLVKHFISEYPILTAAEANVRMTIWERAVVDGQEHDHGWVKSGPEMATAVVRMDRDGGPLIDHASRVTVRSFITNWTIFKSTQSGFDNYLMDKYTLLPPCDERCLSTELAAEWNYVGAADVASGDFDFTGTREVVKRELTRGIFGPAKGGVFSVSLQATIYDAGCLVLTEAGVVESIKIDTPNKHYLPYRQLNNLTETFEDDIFVPTDEPSGTITCTVVRGNGLNA